MKKIIPIALILLLGISVSVCVVGDELPEEKPTAVSYSNTLATPPIPTELTFAGETVPVDVYWVRENLEKEVITQCYLHSRTLLIFKRSGRYFPTIEKILAEEEVPDDLKYLCLAESGLENVTSPAGAAGFWQFMSTTGKSYGLEINNYVDERYQLEKSTRAACKYLKKLRDKFGSWALAAAAYNMGEGGLSRSIAAQNGTEYYDLWLNTETARYVFRILCFKLLFENPENYGVKLTQEEYYKPIPCKEITITSGITSISDFASQHGVLYREVKSLNPWLRSTSLPANGKSYTILIPKQSKAKYYELNE